MKSVTWNLEENPEKDPKLIKEKKKFRKNGFWKTCTEKEIVRKNGAAPPHDLKKTVLKIS